VVGISNFVTFLERTEAYRRDLRRVEYGDERDPKMREFLTRISPLSNARKITRPMFIVQGRNDPRVPYQEAEQIVAQIKQQGGKVWYLLAKDEGHGFARKPNADFQFLATLRFVEENLLR
jgi:dipeptidyl aminopeptidase/acylaminoacyl peptidase